VAFTIHIVDLAADELTAIRVFERRRIVDPIREQLTDQALVETRNRKRLDGMAPGFVHVAPIWELRVGEFRVFYDVSKTETIVFIRAIRRKGPGQTTEDILHD
jgi:mRNA-degrading endonuclease RelE of RelBE toxin-antitoxin system